jgi:hypothetical protein
MRSSDTLMRRTAAIFHVAAGSLSHRLSDLGSFQARLFRRERSLAMMVGHDVAEAIVCADTVQLQIANCSAMALKAIRLWDRLSHMLGNLGEHGTYCRTEGPGSAWRDRPFRRSPTFPIHDEAFRRPVPGDIGSEAFAYYRLIPGANSLHGWLKPSIEAPASSRVL